MTQAALTIKALSLKEHLASLHRKEKKEINEHSPYKSWLLNILLDHDLMLQAHDERYNSCLFCKSNNSKSNSREGFLAAPLLKFN